MAYPLVTLTAVVLAVLFGPSPRCGRAYDGYYAPRDVAGRRGFRAESDRGNANPPRRLEMYVENVRSEKYNVKLVEHLARETNKDQVDTEKYEIVKLPDDMSVTCKGGCPTTEKCDSSSSAEPKTTATSTNRPHSRDPECKPSPSGCHSTKPTRSSATATSTTCRPDTANQQSSTARRPPRSLEQIAADRKSPSSAPPSPSPSPSSVGATSRRSGKIERYWVTIGSFMTKQTRTGKPTGDKVRSNCMCSKCWDGSRGNNNNNNIRKSRGISWER